MICAPSAGGFDPTGEPCPLWVTGRHSAQKTRCPLYPQKQTFVAATGMSALCQKRTFTGTWFGLRVRWAAGLNQQRTTGRVAGRWAVSNRSHAAIDREVHACDVVCFVRSEERGGRRDILWAAKPSERDSRDELGTDLVGPLFGLRQLLEDRRVDRARADRIDPDATILQLRRSRAHERADCRLGGAVGSEAGDAFVLGDRRDHNDRAAII